MKTIINNKRKIIGSYLFAIIMPLSFAFLSCESILENTKDCIINPHPTLPDRQLKVGYFGEPYSDELKAYLRDEPNVDDYKYGFRIDGQIPEGIEIQIFHRTLIFEGVPKQLGTYNFTIHVEVNTSYEVDGFCNNESSKEYTLVIY